MKYILPVIVTLLLLGGIGYYFMTKDAPETSPTTVDVVDTNIEPEPEPNPFEVLPAPEEEEAEPVETIGTSAGGEAVMAYHFGDGPQEVLFIGGIHSGFAPNTVAVAEELIDALTSGDITVPDNVMVTVIPNLNPDASGEPNTLASRLNGNEVDLNRNFDCEWESEGVWRSTPVSGGSAAFSEPEAAALRDYVNSNDIAAAVVYYAAAGGVYASNCGGTLDPSIEALTANYAEAAGYTANDEFDAYAISGDLTNWLAKVNVPAIGVLLSNYTATEWAKNQAGIEAVLTTFAE